MTLCTHHVIEQILYKLLILLSFPLITPPVAPDVTADREHPVDVPVNGTLQISCTHSSIPPPDNVTWTHNSSLGSTPLDPANPRITVSFNDTSTTLTITKMMEDEGGSYECRPENVVGNNTATTHVNIGGKINYIRIV